MLSMPGVPSRGRLNWMRRENGQLVTGFAKMDVPGELPAFNFKRRQFQGRRLEAKSCRHRPFPSGLNLTSEVKVTPQALKGHGAFSENLHAAGTSPCRSLTTSSRSPS